MLEPPNPAKLLEVAQDEAAAVPAVPGMLATAATRGMAALLPPPVAGGEGRFDDKTVVAGADVGGAAAGSGSAGGLGLAVPLPIITGAEDAEDDSRPLTTTSMAESVPESIVSNEDEEASKRRRGERSPLSQSRTMGLGAFAGGLGRKPGDAKKNVFVAQVLTATAVSNLKAAAGVLAGPVVRGRPLHWACKFRENAYYSEEVQHALEPHVDLIRTLHWGFSIDLIRGPDTPTRVNSAKPLGQSRPTLTKTKSQKSLTGGGNKSKTKAPKKKLSKKAAATLAQQMQDKQRRMTMADWLRVVDALGWEGMPLSSAYLGPEEKVSEKAAADESAGSNDGVAVASTSDAVAANAEIIAGTAAGDGTEVLSNLVSSPKKGSAQNGSGSVRTFTVTDARRCFIWSRLLASDECATNATGNLKRSTLDYLDFLEAIALVAHIMDTSQGLCADEVSTALAGAAVAVGSLATKCSDTGRAAGIATTPAELAADISVLAARMREMTGCDGEAAQDDEDEDGESEVGDASQCMAWMEGVVR
jgi:hypothetical protein